MHTMSGPNDAGSAANRDTFLAGVGPSLRPIWDMPASWRPCAKTGRCAASFSG